MQNANEETAERPVRSRTGLVLFGFAGFAAGVLATALLIIALAPGMMLVTHPSRFGAEETVEKIKGAIEREGWVVSGTRNMRKSMAKHGVEFDREVHVVQLGNPEYAREVLSENREVSCLMPCSLSVWEDDDGQVYVSKMNTGLMGKLFGGAVARVMGGPVTRDESAILSGIIAD